MSDWPSLSLAPSGVISAATELTGLSLSPASRAWPAANRAIFVPIRVPARCVAYKLAVGAGATAAGNFDVGLYDSALTRLVSSGATAKGSSVEHILDIAATPLSPGALYYLALAADGANNYITWLPPNLGLSRMLGVLQMATAYPLPATAALAALTAADIPSIAAYLSGY